MLDVVVVILDVSFLILNFVFIVWLMYLLSPAYIIVSWCSPKTKSGILILAEPLINVLLIAILSIMNVIFPVALLGSFIVIISFHLRAHP